MNFIASPEIVTAFAIAGRLSFNPLKDSLTGKEGKAFTLRAPRAAPDVPPKSFLRGRNAYVAPPADGSRIQVAIDPNSNRLQRLHPWPAWDGNDFTDMPILVKTKGKTTTDHISPAGPWLRYRGHLDRFSDNMFMGATNAFTNEVGKGTNIVTGEQHQNLANNARSFARIHETNLKKQGLLALKLQAPADYDSILEHDRISLVDLHDLAPGRPVKCLIRHADGTIVTIRLSHTYSERQIGWFRAGSALNVLDGVKDGQRSASRQKRSSPS